jgi:hypothetical protein
LQGDVINTGEIKILQRGRIINSVPSEKQATLNKQGRKITPGKVKILATSGGQDFMMQRQEMACELADPTATSARWNQIVTIHHIDR